MKGGGFVDGLYTLLFIVAILGAIVLGGYLAVKFYVPATKPAPPAAPPAPLPPGPDPEPHNGWGPGPWGPDPWRPEPGPEPPGPPPPKPAPADNFKPEINLLSAKFDPVSKYIQVGFKIQATGDIPPSKSYSIAYDVLMNGKKLTDLPEDEPLTSAEMTGLQQQSLVPVTGAPADVKASDLTLSAQIHYRENGTVNMGVIGIPVTISLA